MRQKVTPSQTLKMIFCRLPAREVRNRSGWVFYIEQVRTDDIEPEGFRNGRAKSGRIG